MLRLADKLLRCSDVLHDPGNAAIPKDSPRMIEKFYAMFGIGLVGEKTAHPVLAELLARTARHDEIEVPAII